MIPKRLGAVAALLLLAGCTEGEIVACGTDTAKPMRLYQLYFGRTIKGGGYVGKRAWASFRDDTITPALPDGYTIVDADGAWRSSATRRTTTDPTKVLIVALPDTPDSRAAVARVRSAYQARFHQDSVGMTVQSGCGAF